MAGSNVVPIGEATKGTRAKVNRAGTTGAKVMSSSAATGGSAPGGPGDWQHSVEARLGELRSDVRNLLIGGCVLTLAIVGAGWGAYTSAMNQLRDLAVTQQQIAGKIETLDVKVSGRLDLMEQRLSDKPQTSPRAR